MTVGPFETEREARQSAVAGDAASGRATTMADANHRLLCEALSAAGVELGAYDHAIVAWLAEWEPATVAVVAGWISRAHGKAGGLPGTAGAAIEVTIDGEIAVVIGEKTHAVVPDPYAFQRALEQAIERRIDIRAPFAEHLGPVAGDD